MKLFFRVFLVFVFCISLSFPCFALGKLPTVSANEPTASEPTASEPAASEPAASEPTASEPAASEPAASEPTASEPTANEPIVYESGVSLRDLDVNPPNLTVGSAIIHIRFCLVVLTFYYLPLILAFILLGLFFKWVYGLYMRAV